jgi:hypothetical protein
MIGIILYIIASALFFPIAMLNLLVSLYKTIKHQYFYKETNKTFFASAKNIDIFANESFPILWNTLLRKPKTYLFGHKGETLSSTLGKLQRDKGLSIVGWFIVCLLWFIDFEFWFKGGHCLNSIDV